MPESPLPISDLYHDQQLRYPVCPSLMQLFQIQAEHLSAVHASFFIMKRSLLPPLPNLLRRLTVDLPTKPRHPTSTAKTSHLKPLLLQFWASCSYRNNFRSWAHSMFSSHGTVSSTNNMVFRERDRTNMSVHTVTMSVGKTNLPKSDCTTSLG